VELLAFIIILCVIAVNTNLNKKTVVATKSAQAKSKLGQFNGWQVFIYNFFAIWYSE